MYRYIIDIKIPPNFSHDENKLKCLFNTSIFFNREKKKEDNLILNIKNNMLNYIFFVYGRLPNIIK